MKRQSSPAGEVAAAGNGSGDGPKLDFAQRTPYDEYVHTTTLHSLQQTRTADPGEMSFLVTTQVMELYFKLIRFELEQAQSALRVDDVWAALAPLRRTVLHLDALDGAWQGLRWMAPADFNRFRAALGEASGFQSAMYRHIELLLGNKSAPLVRTFRNHPEVHRALVAALEGPSLWDDVLAVLARSGYDIPVEVLERDRTTEHDAHPAVEAAWLAIYRDPGPDNHLRLLGEVLTDLAELFHRWRERHVTMIKRTLGAKSGSGGSTGLAWVQSRLARVVFPELWTARTRM